MPIIASIPTYSLTRKKLGNLEKYRHKKTNKMLVIINFNPKHLVYELYCISGR
jgi:hypothetical protein